MMRPVALDRVPPRESNAEVLFAEARRRRRRRRIAAAVIVVLAGFAGWWIIAVTHGPSGPTPRTGTNLPSAGTPGPDSRPAGTVLLRGKYETPALAVGPGGVAVLWLHGYPGNASRQVAWLDRAGEAGSHWTAGTAVDAVRANGPESEQKFSFVDRSTAIGYDGANGVWVTTDAGLSWRHQLTGWSVPDVATVDGSVRLVGEHCVGEDVSCPPRLLGATPALDRFTALPTQPPHAVGYQLVQGTARTIVAFQPLTGGHWRLAAMRPGRSSWATHELPCQPANSLPLSAADSTLWLSCLARSTGPDVGDGMYRTYRSSNDGRTWTTTAHQAYDLVVTRATGRLSAWGEQTTANGLSLVRTLDGGRDWQSLALPSLSQDSLVDSCVETAEAAWCVIQHFQPQGTFFTVDTTATGSHSWQVTTVPVAGNLPRHTTTIVSPRPTR
jgi:hypothetical protein